MSSNESKIAELRSSLKQLGFNELNRYCNLDAAWSQKNRKNASQRWQTTHSLLLQRISNYFSPEITGIVCEVDALYFSIPLCVLWSKSLAGSPSSTPDDDLDDMSITEFRRHPQYKATESINISLENVAKYFPTLEDSSIMHKLLLKIMPGSWTKSQTTKLFNQQFGQIRFHPSFVKTDPGEVQCLLQFLDLDTLRDIKGIDPFAGTRTIEIQLNSVGIFNFSSNDVNPMLHDNHSATTHFDALSPTTLLNWKNQGLTYCITSPPFNMIDIVFPLFIKTFDIVILHVASGFVSNSPLPRRQLLHSLGAQKRIWFISASEERNKVFQRFVPWLVIARSPQMLQKVIKPNASKSAMPLTIQYLV